MEKSPIISVRDLTKQFGSFTAVDHISFDVYRGEIFGFLGANGAGKTTAMRMLCGLSFLPQAQAPWSVMMCVRNPNSSSAISVI